MIYATHIPKRERKRALRDIYATEPVAPKFNPWSSCLITSDRRDHPTSIHHGGSAALVLDPIIDGFHLTRVLMDGCESALYQLEGGWIGDFYESLQNLGVMKTNSEDYAYYYAAEVRLH